ncbi:MAG TPA: protein-glutamate O-methyltransferase CheR [Gemmatimonadaceae bacterium]|nr:protein-glutamate O-methyltransferase CheR [Gemmatimonadaceae bacterium]
MQPELPPRAPDWEEFGALTSKIARERGFACASYKEKCLRRRIAVRMRACGVHTYGDYARVLDADAHEYDRLLDALTINVTKLFRNWDTFAAVAEHVIPTLWARPDPTIRVWSAGCASGEEPYSLAILFHRYAAAHGVLDALRRVSILGTDIDRACLEAAVRAQFAEPAFADTPPDLRERYFTPEPPFTLRSDTRALVQFARRDLLADPPPATDLQLVICRNVIIYFDRGTQEMLFQRFHDALAPGGFLVLGKVETLIGAPRSGFASVEPRERIFRRL